MAGKQLGKLRQWGREVVSTKEKTVLSEEFKCLQQDIDLRRAGIEKLHGACTEYHGYLQKKKEYTSVEPGVKMLPIDAMGAVMMSHGEEFGQDSAFGQCLQKFGRAHCKIATLQESYALTFRETYLENLESAMGELNDYATQRKKLDSRRLAYDAAITRSAKAKKDKDVKEAEEELNKAKLRYEETSTDVQARMYAIQEKEIDQLRHLTAFLADEIRFAEQYLEVLRDTQREWLDESAIQQTVAPRRPTAPHVFASGRSTPSIVSTSKTSAPVRASTADTTPSEEDGDEGDYGFGAKRRASPSSTPRPSSRGSIASTGTAHTGRRRRDSSGASSDVGGSGGVNKRLSVAGWASSAVSSLGRSKKEAKKDKSTPKQRDKDAGRAFASLGNDGDESSEDTNDPHAPFGLGREEPPSLFGSRPLSKALARTSSMSRPSSNTPDSTSNSSFNSHSDSVSSMQARIVRALHDFTGSSDELSFRAGDQITVISEVKGGWSIGELGGRRGLFPTNYTEAIVSWSPQDPLTTVSSHTMTDLAKRAQYEVMSEDSMSITSADGKPTGLYDEPFGDHHFAKSPMVADHESEAATEEEEEDDMQNALMSGHTMSTLDSPPPIPSVGTSLGDVAGGIIHTGRSPPILPQRKSMERKPPPPLPARRFATATPPLLASRSGGPYISAPSSTANLPNTNFPPPPTVPRRLATRSRSSNAISASHPFTTTSPFDN